MTALDPFTRASATYQNAARHPFKSGQAWEGYAPRRSTMPIIIAAIVILAVIVGFAALGAR